MDRSTTPELHAIEPRRLFQRALASWATDMLELRRKGLDRPSRRFESRNLSIRSISVARDARRRAA